MSIQDLEVGKEVKLLNGTPTENKLIWEVDKIDNKDIIHLKTKTLFGNFFKVVELTDIELP